MSFALATSTQNATGATPPEFTEAMWLILQQEKPEDYVIATGKAHTVRDFARLAFAELDLNYEDYVVVNPKFYRPAKVEILLGDASKAKKELGWKKRPA